MRVPGSAASPVVPMWARDHWPGLLAVLIVIAVWEGLAARSWIKVLFFPPPSRIVAALVETASSGDLHREVGATLRRLAQGVLLGGIPGLLLGLVMGWSARLRRIVDPFVAAIHAIPKIALLPLALVLFGLGDAPRIVLIAVSVFFPMVIGAMTGVRQIHPVYYEVAQNYGARGVDVIVNVLLPASVPEVLAGVRLAVNTALVVAIALEMIASPDGLGRMIWLSWQTMRVERLYACLLVTGLLGVLFNGANQGIAMLVAPWSENVRNGA